MNALAVDITTLDAITDLVDNAWDQWVATGRKAKLEVEVYIDPSHDKIIVKDNAGGIRFENLPLVLAPGGSNRTGAADIFGIYGVGAKRAMHTLGRSVIIETRSKGEPGYRIRVTQAWIDNDTGPDRWNIPYQEDPALEIGTTRITISDLKSTWTSNEVKEAERRLASTYAEILRNKEMALLLNQKSLTHPGPILWARSKNVPPTIVETQLAVPGTPRHIKTEITVGVTVDVASLTEIGFDVVCNGRLVAAHVSDHRLGFDEGRLGSPHFTLNRFRGVIKLDGEPRDLPWNSAKSDLNLNHSIHPALLSLVVEIAKPYTKFLRKNYQYSTTLFTHIARKDDFRRIVLRPGKTLPELVRAIPKETKQLFVRFPVTAAELRSVAAFIGYADRRPGEVGRYVWDYFLEEVMTSER